MTHYIEKVADIDLGNIATQISRGRYYFRRHVVRYQEILKRLPRKRPLTILDIGVGYGFLAAAMKEAGYQVCDRQIIFPGRVSPGGVRGLLGAVVVRLICLFVPKLKNILLVIARPI